MISSEHVFARKAGASRQGSRRRVVILGGGFAGLHAARRLQRTTLAPQRDLEVVLISRENYVLFTPMLHEVAAGDLDPADIVIPLRKTVRQVRLIQANVASKLPEFFEAGESGDQVVVGPAAGRFVGTVTLRDVERMEKFGATLPAMRRPRCPLGLARCQTGNRKPSSLVRARAALPWLSAC